MVTFNQLIKLKHRPLKKNKTYRILNNKPFALVKVVTLRDKPAVQIMSPRKPNSAKRKFVRVFWHQSKKFGLKPTEHRTSAYVPGEIKSADFQPQSSSDLLIRRGRVKDLPGIKFTIVRGHKKSLKGLSYRRNSRSKYGVPLWYLSEQERSVFIYKSFNYR